MAAEVIVRTAPTDAGCGVDFQYGADYLVYAYAFRGELSTDLCTRTGPLSWAQSDIEIFGDPVGCEVAVEAVPWTMIKKLFANR